MSLIITVNYDVSGFDHEGYCSGCDVIDEIKQEWIYGEKTTVKDNFFDGYDILFNNYTENELNNYLIKDLHKIIIDYLKNEDEILDKFNKENIGCTSDGSGYCIGYYQDYYCTSISWCDLNGGHYQIKRTEDEN
jgi:hypothetical protein